MEPKLKAALARHFARHAHEVAAVYVFGSHARGEASSASDLDLAVLLRASPPRTLAGLRLDLAVDLQTELGLSIDLVILNRAPVDLVHRVLRDGVLVAEFDASTRIQFEVKARNEHFDLARYLEHYRRPARISS